MSVLAGQTAGEHRADDARYRPPRARGRARAGACHRPQQKNAALDGHGRCASRHARGAILAANANDIDAARGKGRRRGLHRPAEARTTARIEAMAKGLRDIAALPDPVGEVTRALDAAERPAHRARAHAARRHRRHLREPAQRDGRRRRALPQVRQRGDPARRLGELSHSSLAICNCLIEGLAAAGSAGGRDPARADDRPRRRRRDARRPRRHYRRDRAARRQEPGRARAGRGARAGVRASRRPLPRLCRIRRPISTWRKTSCSTPRCGAPASAAPPRRCSSIAPRRRPILRRSGRRC